MGGLAPPSSCGPGGGTRYAPSRAALADIPGNYLRWIRDAGDRYGLDWSVLAGDLLDRDRLRTSRRTGRPVGRELRRRWRARPVPRADVADLRRRRRWRWSPGPLQPGRRHPGNREPPPTERRAGGLSGARSSPTTTRVGTSTTSSRVQIATAARPRPTRAQSRPRSWPTPRQLRRARNSWTLGGPADLSRAVRLTFPAAYRALPAWAMAAGRAPESVDARIYNDVVWLLRAAQPARDSSARGGPPHPRRRHGGRSRSRGRRDPARLGSH